MHSKHWRNDIHHFIIFLNFGFFFLFYFFFNLFNIFGSSFFWYLLTFTFFSNFFFFKFFVINKWFRKLFISSLFNNWVYSFKISSSFDFLKKCLNIITPSFNTLYFIDCINVSISSCVFLNLLTKRPVSCPFS